MYDLPITTLTVFQNHSLFSSFKNKEQHYVGQDDSDQQRRANELKNMMRIKSIAAIRIQKISRGGITRERVKKIRMARWHELGEGLQMVEEDTEENQYKELKVTRNIKGMFFFV